MFKYVQRGLVGSYDEQLTIDRVTQLMKEFRTALSHQSVKVQAKQSPKELSLTSNDTEEIKKRFPIFSKSSFHRNERGYYATTRNYKTPYYKSIDNIPVEQIQFMEDDHNVKGLLHESITSSKKRAKFLADQIAITPAEREEIEQLFGTIECSFKHNSKGYYCTTQRCRSKYYASIKEIPKSKVDFVSSTS